MIERIKGFRRSKGARGQKLFEQLRQRREASKSSPRPKPLNHNLSPLQKILASCRNEEHAALIYGIKESPFLDPYFNSLTLQDFSALIGFLSKGATRSATYRGLLGHVIERLFVRWHTLVSDHQAGITWRYGRRSVVFCLRIGESLQVHFTDRHISEKAYVLLQELVSDTVCQM